MEAKDGSRSSSPLGDTKKEEENQLARGDASSSNSSAPDNTLVHRFVNFAFKTINQDMNDFFESNLKFFDQVSCHAQCCRAAVCPSSPPLHAAAEDVTAALRLLLRRLLAAKIMLSSSCTDYVCHC